MYSHAFVYLGNLFPVVSSLMENLAGTVNVSFFGVYHIKSVPNDVSLFKCTVLLSASQASKDPTSEAVRCFLMRNP